VTAAPVSYPVPSGGVGVSLAASCCFLILEVPLPDPGLGPPLRGTSDRDRMAGVDGCVYVSVGVDAGVEAEADGACVVRWYLGGREL
jgi:hypothetical protein